LRRKAINSDKSRRPDTACFIILTVAVLAAATCDDPVLILACGFVTALTVALLWRLGEPPILLMAAGLQLSQVVMLPAYASLLGVPLQTLSLSGLGDLTSGAWFALAGMVSLVAGMWCGQLGARLQAGIQIEARALSPRSAFLFCVVTMLFSALFDVVGSLYEGLKQPAVAASGVQWLGVFVLASVCAAQRRGFIYLLVVMVVDVLRGLAGFFAGFQDVIFVVLVGIFAVRPKLELRSVVVGLALAGGLLTLGAFWSVVKMEYRSYANLGTGQQAVLIPIEDRFGYLIEKAVDADSGTMALGFDLLAKRWGYIEMLAATIQNVPARVPYQDGTEMGAAVMHLLQPRLLFPDKPPLRSDTESAVRYTGIRFDQGNNAAGTSISLGYFAELYVDFGFVGALVATFILGLLLGCSVKMICSSTSLPTIMNSGLSVMLTMSMISFSENLLKMLASFVMTLLIVLILRRLLVPFILNVLGPIKPARLGVI
jgi:hypothetical protein